MPEVAFIAISALTCSPTYQTSIFGLLDGEIESRSSSSATKMDTRSNGPEGAGLISSRHHSLPGLPNLSSAIFSFELRWKDFTYLEPRVSLVTRSNELCLVFNGHGHSLGV